MRRPKKLAPFWRYYGGKNRVASRYPAPEHDTVVEPFAGAAGYSCRHYDKRVILLESSPVVAGVWRYLINAKEDEILRLPDLPHDATVDDLDVCQEAKWLIGFWCNTGTVNPAKRQSARSRQYGMDATNWAGWGHKPRERIAKQLQYIRHWTIVLGDYTMAPDIDATWHIDPPYNNSAGRCYTHQPDSYDDLAVWCRLRRGLVMVCENEGADWLPFEPFAHIKGNNGAKRSGVSKEVIWVNRTPALPTLVEAECVAKVRHKGETQIRDVERLGYTMANDGSPGLVMHPTTDKWGWTITHVNSGMAVMRDFTQKDRCSEALMRLAQSPVDWTQTIQQLNYTSRPRLLVEALEYEFKLRTTPPKPDERTP